MKQTKYILIPDYTIISETHSNNKIVTLKTRKQQRQRQLNIKYLKNHTQPPNTTKPDTQKDKQDNLSLSPKKIHILTNYPKDKQ